MRMAQVKIAFLIPFSAKFQHHQNAVAQAKSCFSELPDGVTVHYLVAEGTSLPDEIRDKSLATPGADGYFQVLKKTMTAIDMVLRDRQPDFIVRGNSSNYYQIPRIIDFLRVLDCEEYFYGGRKTSVTDEMTPLERDVTYAGGSGIYLNRAAAAMLLSLPVGAYAGVVDDVAIGDYFQKNGVSLVDLERNDVTDYEPIKFCLQTRVKSWESNGRTVKRFEILDVILKERRHLVRAMRSYFFFVSELLFLLRKKRLDASVRVSYRFRPLW